MTTSLVSVRKSFRLALAAGGILALSGCVSLWRSNQHQSGSIVQFLYPGKDPTFVQPRIPTLRLPLRIGIAFVPATGDWRDGGVTNTNFSEAQKTELMRSVAAQFKALPFVESIQIVPTTYLRPGGGFENLDQLRALMGIDVVALLAYDQVQSTGDTAWSFTYLTVVGAYVVPAQKNDTHTLMEAVVYDIPSRSLLFRAPGVSTVNARSTLVDTLTGLRENSLKGYTDAAKDLTANLQIELDHFKIRAKEEPEAIHIEHKACYTGGGALDGWFAAGLALILAGGFIRSRR
jgi:rhombotail lipoprotein